MSLTESTKVLVKLLARVDSLHWPGRQTYRERREQVVCERRRAYVKHGMPVTCSGNAADRQRFGRLLADLAGAGLLEIIGERRQGCRLTPDGDSVVRRMTGCFTQFEVWDQLEVSASWQDVFGARPWPEHLAAGIDEYTGTPEQARKLGQARQALVPFLSAGYVETHGDGGHPRAYWLSLTDSGRAALIAGPPDDAPDAVVFAQSAADAYDRCWTAYQKELSAAKPEFPNILAIPAAYGIGWGSLSGLVRRMEKAR